MSYNNEDGQRTVMIAIHPKRITGKWKGGMALDVHTVSSLCLGPDEFGPDQFDTKRSEMGELLYRLKYGSDVSAVMPIVETACDFISKNIKGAPFDLIVPAPFVNQETSAAGHYCCTRDWRDTRHRGS